jgi:BMFP domain-containing protein YqiC
MHSNDPFNELLERLQAFAPDLRRWQELGDEARQQLRGGLEAALREAGVLTRDEFEAQRQALERAEQRITALEQALRDLEAQQ